MAKDTITVTGKNSCACHCGNYTEVTKTYKNYCPRCGKSGTLADSPKRTVGPEGEITCDVKLGGCGADYCINCGGDKSNRTSCSREDWKLKPADASDDEDNESSASTYKDMILDLISVWDGDVECRIEDNKIYINKIPSTDTAKISLIEGANIISDSVNIHDVNPDTINTLVAVWGNNNKTITIKDNRLIKRFGEKKQVSQAVKKIVTYSEEKVEKSSTSDED